MLIFVRRLQGAPLNIDIDVHESVLQLKTLLQLHTGVAPANQKLIYAGRVLADDNSLLSYNLQKECTIQLYETLRAVAAEEDEPAPPSTAPASVRVRVTVPQRASITATAPLAPPPNPIARGWRASPVLSNDMIVVQLVEARDLAPSEFFSRASPVLSLACVVVFVLAFVFPCPV